MRGAAAMARWLGAAGLALALWFAVLALGTVAALPPRVLAIGPREALIAATVRSGARLAGVGSASGAFGGTRSWAAITVADADRAGLAALYAAGAVLVIPARSGGCGIAIR
jgi:hypothetical protein